MKKIKTMNLNLHKVFGALTRKSQSLAKRVVGVRKRLRRKLARIGRLELEYVLTKLAINARYQMTIRPRLRLVLAIIVILTAVFATSSQAVNYIKPKEAEIKINGQQLIVAAENRADDQKVQRAQIDQIILAKISPFEAETPVDEGLLSQGFAPYHRAVDIATKLGTPIKSVGPGTVVFTGFMPDGKGNAVIVDHGDSLKTLYAHMGKITVGIGDQVDSKTVIGSVGLTGRTTGAHVHFEVLDNDIQVDPDNLLP